MKKIHYLLILLFSNGNIFSETINLLEENNTFGGKTIETIVDDEDIETKRYSKLIRYYDNINNLVKMIITPSPTIINERGIVKQIDYYNGGGIEKYEMIFSDSFKEIHDYNRIIEEMGNNDLVIKTIWYIDDDIIDIIEHPREMNKFVFYNIKFIENEFLQGYEPNSDPTKDVVTISYKYVSIRSVIKFDAELVDLNNIDVNIIETLLRRFEASDLLSIYTKKVKVYFNNNYYWLFVQKQLEDYVKGQDATISYYPILWNEKLYLLCIGFYDIKKSNGT
jgi:hypothetical protein